MSTIPKELIREGDAEIRRVNGRAVFVGRLPDDFLRVPNSENIPEGEVACENGMNSYAEQRDRQLAWQLQQEFNCQGAERSFREQYSAQIIMTVVDAKLNKNYGLLNMSTFVRFRVGHIILETRTAHRGGKEPKWNERIRCTLPRNIDTIWVEIYQECLMTADERIAEGHFEIPPELLQFSQTEHNKILDARIPLTGKQGSEPGSEGVLKVVFSFSDIYFAQPAPMPRATPVYLPDRTYYSRFYPYTSVQTRVPIVPAYVSPGYIEANTPGSPVSFDVNDIPLFREEDFNSLKEMFPKIDPEIIRNMLESNGGNVNPTITALLELNSTTQ